MGKRYLDDDVRFGKRGKFRVKGQLISKQKLSYLQIYQKTNEFFFNITTQVIKKLHQKNKANKLY